jgi:hypothetical protein
MLPHPHRINLKQKPRLLNNRQSKPLQKKLLLLQSPATKPLPFPHNQLLLNRQQTLHLLNNQ